MKLQKKISLALLLLTIMAPIGLSYSAAESSTLRALRILRQIDDLWRADSSHSILTMQVHTAHYSRTVRMENWSKGKDKSLVRIITPRKEKGVATLKYANAIYTYLPKTDRTIRLTSSMMMGSWMGSHFTNDDLVKESRLSDDYDADITFEGSRNGRGIIEFTLLPKADAPVVWGKIVTLVTAGDLMPIQSLYFDDDMILARTINFEKIKVMDGRLLPSVLRVIPADKGDEFTQLTYGEIKFGLLLADSFFSLQQLRRR